MTERARRCRYQVWERGRGARPYQCQSRAVDERELTIRAHRIDGELVKAATASLPVCGTHRNVVDRDPRPDVHSAYQWTDSDGPYRARVAEYVR